MDRLIIYRVGLGAVAAFVVIQTVRALIIGAASASMENITRSDEPLAYWGVIVAAVVVASILIWKLCHVT